MKIFSLLDRALRTAFAATVSLCLTIAPALPQAALLPNAKQTFLDSNGNPLASGKVYSYVPNTTTFKTTWSNSGQTASNTNPVTLDSAGRAVIYGQGSYQQRVTDALGNPIWNAPTTAYGSAAPSGATGTDTAPVGSILPFSGFTVPTNWQLAYGQAVVRVDFPDLLAAITVSSTTVSCTASSVTLTGWADTSIFKVGAPVEASCIPTGTTVASTPTSTSITVNNAAVSTGTVTARVFPWGNGNGVATFNVPDLRGRVIAGPDSQGGAAASRLTTTYFGSSAAPPAAAGGSQSHAMMTAELVAHNHTAASVVTDPGHDHPTTDPGHDHSISDPGHTHTITDPGHTHSITDPGHTHVERASAAASGSLNAPLTTATGNTGSSQDLSTNSATTGITGTAVNVTGITSANTHTTGITGTQSKVTGLSVDTRTTGVTVATTTSNTGSTTPFTLVQPTLTVNYIIKVTPNSTGAGGVVSLGGMIGDIVCDATLLCAPVGSPAVNTVGLAQQSNNTLLANVSGITATPLPATLTQWLDSSCGSTRGMMLARGASTWGCVAPGAAGTGLVLNGSLDPVWTALMGTGTVTSVAMTVPSILSVAGSPVTTSGTLALSLATQSPNLVFAGPTSGGAATPAFRALVAADLPVVSNASGSPSATFGAMKCDGVTVTCASGTVTAVNSLAASIRVGTTTISSGTTNRLLFDNAGVLGELILGTGLVNNAGTLNLSGTVVSFYVTKTGADQTLAAGASSYTQITFPVGGVSFNVGGYYNTSTSQFTPPAGTYLITGTIYFSSAGSTAGEGLGVIIRKNGSDERPLWVHRVSTSGQSWAVSNIVTANGVDAFELDSWAANGGLLAQGTPDYTSFSAVALH